MGRAPFPVLLGSKACPHGIVHRSYNLGRLIGLVVFHAAGMAHLLPLLPLKETPVLGLSRC